MQQLSLDSFIHISTFLQWNDFYHLAKCSKSHYSSLYTPFPLQTQYTNLLLVELSQVEQDLKAKESNSKDWLVRQKRQKQLSAILQNQQRVMERQRKTSNSTELVKTILERIQIADSCRFKTVVNDLVKKSMWVLDGNVTEWFTEKWKHIAHIISRALRFNTSSVSFMLKENVIPLLTNVLEDMMLVLFAKNGEDIATKTLGFLRQHCYPVLDFSLPEQVEGQAIHIFNLLSMVPLSPFGISFYDTIFCTKNERIIARGIQFILEHTNSKDRKERIDCMLKAYLLYHDVNLLPTMESGIPDFVVQLRELAYHILLHSSLATIKCLFDRYQIREARFDYLLCTVIDFRRTGSDDLQVIYWLITDYKSRHSLEVFDSQPAIGTAILRGVDTALLGKLLEMGYSPNKPASYKTPILLMVERCSEWREVAELLYRYGAYLYCADLPYLLRTNHQCPCIHQKIEWLVKKGLDINRFESTSRSNALRALFENRTVSSSSAIELMDTLLDNGADPAVKDERDQDLYTWYTVECLTRDSKNEELFKHLSNRMNLKEQ